MSDKPALKACYAAIPTPFFPIADVAAPPAINYDALDRHLQYLVDGEVDGVVVAGTTGLASLMPHDMHVQLVEYVNRNWGKKLEIVVGDGSNCTWEAIRLARSMEKAGVYRHLGVSPYYLKPADEGLSGHFKAVADNIDGYEILYNIPGRTAGLGIPLDVSVRLAAHPRIIGQKEATGKAETAERLVKATDGMGFTVLSGDDGMTLPMMQVGAKGVISVAVNVDPKRVSRMVHLAEVGDFKGASTINNELGGLYGALFPKRTEGNTTPNPGMLYYALRRMGLDYPAPPLPITDGITTERAEVDKALRGLSLIE